MSAAAELPVARFDLRAPRVWLPLLIALAAFLAILATNQNRSVFLALNALGPLTSDDLWAHVTVLGDTVVALALCVPLWRRRPDLIWALAIGALLATAWVHVLKPIVKAPRPVAVLGADAHVIGPTYRKQSFPSGHSTTAFAVAGLIALGLAPGLRTRASPTAHARNPDVSHGSGGAPAGGAPDAQQHGSATRVWSAVAVGVALLAAVSRSVVGVHWPLDLLAGAFGGWLAAAAGLALARRTLTFGTRPAVQWIMGSLLAGCAVALVFGHDSGYPQAMTFQRIIGVVCLGCVAVALWGVAPGTGAHSRHKR